MQKKEAGTLCVVYDFIVAWNVERRLGREDEESMEGGRSWDEEGC
ncbi:hypothetical protein [Bartonella sp. OT172YNZD]